MRDPFRQIACDRECKGHEFEAGDMDPVHLFVTAPPKFSLSLIIQYLKGIPGRKLYIRFPALRDKQWNGER
jgi:putative transposase